MVEKRKVSITDMHCFTLPSFTPPPFCTHAYSFLPVFDHIMPVSVNYSLMKTAIDGRNV